MSDWRIVSRWDTTKDREKFDIQKKHLRFFWLTKNYYSFDTFEEAERELDYMKKWHEVRANFSPQTWER